jgi:uridine phosphorylase
MSTFDKSQVGAEVAQYATRVKKGDVGKYVLLPGDPDRVGRIAKYLEDAKEVAFCREFRTVTGTYKGIVVSAMSTGIGCPSASMAVEELANVGATHFIRVGSTAALQPHIKTGDIIINTGTQRNDGTTRAYVPENFPAVPDHFLVRTLIDTALDFQKEKGFGIHVGLNACDDAFYAETPEWIEDLAKHKLLNVEMESAAIFTVAYLRGLHAAMVCAVSANLVKPEEIDYDLGEHGNVKLVQGWENEIMIALEAIARYDANPPAI